MNQLGRVAELWRFPVKSMRGERIDSALVGKQGMIGDRAFALLDVEQNKKVTAKNLRRFPDIFRYKAGFVREPVFGEALPPVRIGMPDGRVIDSDHEGVDDILSASLGHAVKLIRVDAADVTAHHDAAPVSVLTNSTLARLRQLQPKSDFDVRRFRMNIIVETEESGFAENEWLGRNLLAGAELKLHITVPNARCVMTTLAQDELPEDRSVFTALMQHNRLAGDDGRPAPCAGVYARALVQGTVSVGDIISE
ncbi:MAG TPA: MOSC domain-containing protein [Xanthomonadales bacterium]|nr:MOSC domain-containing protein [Xanthomonadales bacterium]